MPIARAEIVEPNEAGLYHCVSRCVRRALLCGGENGEYEHRRRWLEKRLEELTAIFAIDVVAYAVMANHVHVLLWTDPQRVAGWKDLEVARRWLTLFPGAERSEPNAQELAKQIAGDAKRVEAVRARLSSLSWFNRCLKEPLSRMANAEDGCTGVFWEGRFKSYRVVDEAGALSCAVYIDLNAIRAGLARMPEESRFTSVRQRIERRQAFKRQGRVSRGKVGRSSERPRGSSTRSRRQQEHRPAVHAESGLWLTPFSKDGARESKRRSLFDIGVDAYIGIVDAIGRGLRSGKRGAIPAALRPILQRLDHDVNGWRGALERKFEQLWGTTIGRAEALVAEAMRRGRKWVVNPLGPAE